MDEKFSLLRELIAINSIYPNEKEISEFLLNYLEQLGFKAEKQYIAPDRFNILAEKGEGNEVLALYGHMDTVDICGGWETDPFVLTEDGDKLLGRGALDMKAGLFVILKAIKEAVIPANKKLKVIFGVDEEDVSRGAYAIIETDFLDDINLLISADSSQSTMDDNPDQQRIVISKRGQVYFKIIALGKTAHGSMPHKGVNAIEEACKIVEALKEMKLASHPETGDGKQNVRYIEAESHSIPDQCELHLARYLVPPETIEGALEETKTFLNKIHQDGRLYKEPIVNFGERDTPYLKPFITDRNLPQVQNAKKITEKFFKSVVFDHGMAVADENIFATVGKFPVISIPPQGGNVHGANEWSNKNVLLKLIDVYKGIIES